ncbi:MAG TPA: c-type cytochrome [Gemmatimonadaceae bacterium]|nr:c-type cytochrome [Gemmatimonadaceae bacterium]
MRIQILILTAAVGAIAVAGCQNESNTQAAAGAPPANAYFIGPQPGPDRALIPVKNPYAGDTRVLADGRRLFNWYNCSGCHGDHAGGGMGPSLRDSAWYYGGDEASIFASIAEGRQHGMPSWGSKLPSDDIWKIVTYIKSLRTPDEPDPPR